MESRTRSGRSTARTTQGDAGTSLLSRYRRVRKVSERLCEPLSPEDTVVQSMTEASPIGWQLAHTSWFFEQFVLSCVPGFRPFHPQFSFLFNSYYETVGERQARERRGLITRPGLETILRYRRYVDDHMVRALESDCPEPHVALIGTHHEQQHQELMLTDLKHLLSLNPLQPVYLPREHVPGPEPFPQEFRPFSEGVREIGHAGERGGGFAFDNEGPRHKVFQQPFALAKRTVTVGEYLEFIEDGGYRRPELWLSDGWATVTKEDWSAPLYWEQREGAWWCFTLAGLRPVDPSEPVCHVSFYEADAFARWAGARLPTEAEWEVAAADQEVQGNFVGDETFHPLPAQRDEGFSALFGDVWEWTQDAYSPYPGFNPPDGALGEYNGKFMSNQFILRGGSCASSQDHLRATYRNFFYPEARWAVQRHPPGARPLIRTRRRSFDAALARHRTPGPPRAARAFIRRAAPSRSAPARSNA